jgi:hypothetical protein
VLVSKLGRSSKPSPRYLILVRLPPPLKAHDTDFST